jgi:hypothetical protein
VLTKIVRKSIRKRKLRRYNVHGKTILNCISEIRVRRYRYIWLRIGTSGQLFELNNEKNVSHKNVGNYWKN